MSVRGISKTTITIAVFLHGLQLILRNYFTFLSERLPDVMPHIHGAHDRWDVALYELSTFYPSMVIAVLVLALIASIYDAILKKKVAFGLFASVRIPVLYAFVGIILLLFPLINVFILWGIILLLQLLGAYFTFAKLINAYFKDVVSHGVGYGASFKLVSRSVKKIIETESSRNKDTYIKSTVDRMLLYFLAVLAALAVIVTLFAIIVYGVTNWESIVLVIQG